MIFAKVEMNENFKDHRKFKHLQIHSHFKLDMIKKRKKFEMVHNFERLIYSLLHKPI